jgi:transcriptional regulator
MYAFRMAHYGQYRTADLQKIYPVIANFPFATIVLNNPQANVPDIVNVPVIRGESENILEFHIARENPAFPGFKGEGAALAVFNGPGGHISPAWYQTRFAGGGQRSQTAPTWNYIQAQVSGTLRSMDHQALCGHLERLVLTFEGREGWRFDELDSAILESWSRHIAGFYMDIEKAEAVFKLSQEQTPADIQAVIERLRRRGRPLDDLLADMMESFHLAPHD